MFAAVSVAAVTAASAAINPPSEAIRASVVAVAAASAAIKPPSVSSTAVMPSTPITAASSATINVPRPSAIKPAI